MGLGWFCPRHPESEPLLYNAKQFTRYEIVLHKPPPQDWIVVKNISRDEFVVDKVNYYILKEWGVKPGHLLRRVQRDTVQGGVNPIRGMEKKKYPLTIVFAMKRAIVKNASTDNEEESEDVSRDSFVSLRGVALFDGPPDPPPIRKLNNRDLVCKTEELEAALKNLNKQFRKQRAKYVESSKKYKAKDLQQRTKLQKGLHQQEEKLNRSVVAGGSIASIPRPKPKPSSRRPRGANKAALDMKEGYLMKFGAQGSKKAKRKWVRFSIGIPKGEENSQEKRLILQYSDDANHFEKSPDKGFFRSNKITENVVIKMMDHYDIKTTDAKHVKRTQFGVWVVDGKDKQKGIVFGSESEDTRKAWSNYVEDLLEELNDVEAKG